MHIQEGILSNSTAGLAVLGLGAAGAILGTAVGLSRMDDDNIPRVAVLGSAFFVASLIHLPLGPSSVHLVLNGLAGVILGWACFPALLIALVLQTILFGFGGFTTLGLNLFNLALPGVLVHHLVGGLCRLRGPSGCFWGGFGAGAGGVLGGTLLTGTCLLAAGGEFQLIAEGVVLAHLPVMVVEGFVTGSVVVFLQKVRPEILGCLLPTQTG